MIVSLHDFAMPPKTKHMDSVQIDGTKIRAITGREAIARRSRRRQSVER